MKSLKTFYQHTMQPWKAISLEKKDLARYLALLMLLAGSFHILSPDPKKFATATLTFLVGILLPTLLLRRRDWVYSSWILFAIICCGLILRNNLNTSAIGDSWWVVEFFEQKVTFARWLGFSYFLHNFQTLLENVILIGPIWNHLDLASLRVVQGILISVSFFLAIHLIRNAVNKNGVILVLFSPIVMLFISGHIEVYLISGLCLILTMESILRKDSPLSISAWFAMCALLYMGTWHVLAGLGFFLLLRRTSDFGVIFLLSLMIFLLGVEYMWSDGLQSFLRAMVSESATGTKNLVAAYRPHTGSSIFWKPGFLFTWAHLSIMAYIGAVGFASLLALCLLKGRSFNSIIKSTNRSGEDLLFILAISIPAICYTIMMVPRFGIEKDFDLFTISIMTILYGLGLLFEDMRSLSSLILPYLLLSIPVLAMIL